MKIQDICEEIDKIETVEELQEIETHLQDNTYPRQFWEFRAIAISDQPYIIRKKAAIKARIIVKKYHSQVPVSKDVNVFTAPHGFDGIHISTNAKIGKGCTIFQHVTIGSNTLPDSKNKGFPVIGDNVFIGAGANIIGGVKIGNNVRIGANCTVTKDVPDNSVVIMSGLKIIKKQQPLVNRFLSINAYEESKTK